jgi:DNA-binding GntR family transcriptional regulator
MDHFDYVACNGYGWAMATFSSRAGTGEPVGAAVGAAEHAYEATKRAIIRGELAPGAMTSELLVCQQLGLSRTPVHDAFLRLAGEGLLSLESRKGAVVRPMSPSEARDVLEMRESVEAAAATRVIADGAGAELAATLAGLLAQQESAAASGDVEAFIEADHAFHAEIIAASGNAIAVYFTGFLRDRQQRLRHQLFRVRPGELLVVVLEQHRALAAALADADAERYRLLLAEHVASHGVTS